MNKLQELTTLILKEIEKIHAYIAHDRDKLFRDYQNALENINDTNILVVNYEDKYYSYELIFGMNNDCKFILILESIIYKDFPTSDTINEERVYHSQKTMNIQINPDKIIEILNSWIKYGVRNGVVGGNYQYVEDWLLANKLLYIPSEFENLMRSVLQEIPNLKSTIFFREFEEYLTLQYVEENGTCQIIFQMNRGNLHIIEESGFYYVNDKPHKLKSYKNVCNIQISEFGLLKFIKLWISDGKCVNNCNKWAHELWQELSYPKSARKV